MAARVCQMCSTAWPALTKYGRCPRCEVATQHDTRRDAEYTQVEAHKIVSRIKFDRFYAGWDLEREQRGDPSPDVLGRLEAKEILARRQEEIEVLEHAVGVA